MTIVDRVRVEDVTLLSDNWYVLKKTTFSYLRADGTWQRQTRETYDRGNGAAILLYDLARRTIVLVSQFRYPAFVNGHDDLLLEVPAGLLDDAEPETRIRAEVEEETGFRVKTVRKIFDAFMSPGSVTERLHFFVGEYGPGDRVSAGGGEADEGEDIAVEEVTIEDALAMIQTGAIRDAKTIMLLQYAALHLFPGK
jgi:nudix-type nucleoside diphosphatase (YffH/AdpP family)